MRTIDLGKERISDVLNNELKEIALVGQVTLNDANVLSRYKLDVLDLNKATFGIEKEECRQFLGDSHSGAIYGGVKDVEVLMRILESVSTTKIILPDDVKRRHIIRIRMNNSIRSIEVTENSLHFSMKYGHLFNKNGHILIYENS